MTFLVQDLETIRPIIHRTSGRAHGVITRLVSPHDVGELIKPFVFLDLLDTSGREFSGFRTASAFGDRDVDLHR